MISPGYTFTNHFSELPEENKVGRLLSYYFFYFFWGPYATGKAILESGW